MDFVEGVVFVTATVASVLASGGDGLVRLSLAWLAAAVALAFALFAVRPALVFPCLLVVSLSRMDAALMWPAVVSSLAFLLRSAVSPRLAWCVSLLSPLAVAHIMVVECLAQSALFSQAFVGGEFHVVAALLVAMLRFVWVSPQEPLALAALPLLALLLLGMALAYRERRCTHWTSFGAAVGAAVCASLLASRVLAGHWMLYWSAERVLRHAAVAAFSAAVLLAGLAVIIVWVALWHSRAGALGFAQRKLFHVLIVAIFAGAMRRFPASEWLPALQLAAVAALCALLLVELTRSFAPNGAQVAALNQWYGQWIDARDRGAIATTHLQLLLGCAVPVMFSQGRLPVATAGLVVIGVGDACAAVVGSRWGRLRWSATNRRTVEGTIAMAVASAAAYWWLASLDASAWWVWGGVSVSAALMEAHTQHTDNLLLPLFAVSLLA